MKLRIAKESDDIPGFITGEEDDEKGYFNISKPVVKNISTNSAVIKSTIIFEYVNCTQKGICYSIQTTPTIDDKCINQNSNTTNITLSKLEPGKVYCVRSFAIINGQVHYGEQLSFITNDLFIDQLQVHSYHFYCKINYKYKGTDYVEVKAGLCYGTSPNPTLETANITRTMEIPFDLRSELLDNLKLGTTYYLRPYTIENGKVTYYRETKITTVGRDLILKIEHKKGDKYIECDVDVYEGGPYEVKLYFYNVGYDGPFEIVKYDWGKLDSKSPSSLVLCNREVIEGMGFQAHLYIEAVDVNTKYKYYSNTFYEGNLQ